MKYSLQAEIIYHIAKGNSRAFLRFFRRKGPLEGSAFPHPFLRSAEKDPRRPRKRFAGIQAYDSSEIRDSFVLHEHHAAGRNARFTGRMQSDCIGLLKVQHASTRILLKSSVKVRSPAPLCGLPEDTGSTQKDKGYRRPGRPQKLVKKQNPGIRNTG